MNDYSLINNMARIVDETKIEKIKSSAIELIVNEGYAGASIMKIAKKAGVAEGYLYRFYASKQDLVKDLLRTNMNKIIERLEQSQQNTSNISEIFENIIRLFFEMAKNHSDSMKFIYVLMNDYNYIIDEDLKSKIFELCVQMKKIGQQNNQLHSSIDEEDIYIFGVSYPIIFINHRLKNFFGTNALDEAAIQKVLQNSIKALTIKN